MTEAVTTAWPYDRLGPDGTQPWLWLHGWGQDRRGLARIAGQFAREAGHILYDQPGFGAAEQLADDAGTEDYARALLAQPDFKDPTIVVGHSFGCRVAVQAARLAPERVKALIFIAGAGPKRPRSPLWHMRAAGLRLMGRLAGAADRVSDLGLREQFRQRYGSVDYKAAGALRQTFVKVVSEDLGAVAHQVACPVLLIYGDRDTEAPPVLGEIYKRVMPDARLHVLPGYGHFDILDRGAYQVEALIRAFLTETGL